MHSRKGAAPELRPYLPHGIERLGAQERALLRIYTYTDWGVAIDENF